MIDGCNIMESGEQEQEWIVVKSRKSRRIEKEPKPEKVHMKGGIAPFDPFVNTAVEQQFLAHPNIHRNTNIVCDWLKGLKAKRIHLTCLGIGSFSAYLKPQLQMLFLKHCLISPIRATETQLSLNIYDPIFNIQEKKQLQALNSTSCEMKGLQDSAANVLFMPHCDRFLYQRICEWKSGNPNCEVIVIGNSINEYKQRCKITNQDLPGSLLPYSPLQTKICDYGEAFNDTFIYTL